MVSVLLVVQKSLKILNEALINFIRRDRPKINHSCLMGKKKRKDLAENVLSYTEYESDDRAASKTKVTK